MNFTVLIRVLLFCFFAFIGSQALLIAQPALVNIEGANLYPHGTNAGHPAPASDPFELTDSVTLNSTTKYYILPDATANPLFNILTDPFADVVSTFNWNVPIGLAADQDDAVAAYPAAFHYKQITWTSIGTGNISTTETSTDLCTSDAVLTPVEVIAAPDVTAITIANVSCQTTPISVACPNATLTISCAVNGNKGVEVAYSLSGPTGFVTINSSAVLNNSTTLTLSGNILTIAGAYTLTITTLTDRIAKKCGMPAIAETESKTFYVTPSPGTNPLMHVTNTP